MTTENENDRPGLAIIANCITPYRVHLHETIAAGIPELKLHTLFTHGAAEFAWTVGVPTSINASFFGAPTDSPLASVFRAPLAEWRKGGRLIRYLQENDVRAVICCAYRYISYLRTIRYCHRAGIPVFVANDSNIRCEDNMSPMKQFLKSRVYAWWMPHVSGVMPMGEYGDQFFLKYGADPQRLYRLPCWPDFGRYARSDPERLERFRRKYGLRPERRYLLYSGRLVPKKRVDLLMDAFAALAADRPDWDLLIVGDGWQGEQLRKRIPEPLRSRVIWTGFLEQDDCISSYHSAEVLVLPSDREPWALVVQEAMAAGLVVIASDVVGAAHDMVKDRVSGRIFPAGDLAAFKQAILDITDGSVIASYRQQSSDALAAWQQKANPIIGVRRAMVDCGVLVE
jgi:glycosyltransferase involved in cell wall biosynthesis